MYVHRKYSQFLLPQQGKRIGAACLICLLTGTSYLHSMENNGRGTKAIGMANAFVAVSDNLWAINYNPAGLTQVTGIQCAAFIIPNQFGLPELRTTALAAAVPFSFATFALKAEKFGFDLYKETEVGMAFALKLDQNISGGLSLNLHRLDIARYGSTQNVIFNGGILAYALKGVKVGFNFNNMMGATVGRLGEKIPQLFALGACWSPLDDLLVSLEMEKDIRYPASIKWGMEQMVFDVLVFHAGVANNPEKYSAGIAVKYSFFEFGYAGYSHLDLGWTHQIEISFKLDDE
jgi:hypothetical protein